MVVVDRQRQLDGLSSVLAHWTKATSLRPRGVRDGHFAVAIDGRSMKCEILIQNRDHLYGS